MNGYERSHLAGLVDSVGGRIEVSVSRGTHVIPMLVVVNRSESVVRRLTNIGGPDYDGIEARRASGRMTWRCRGDEAIDLLRVIRPMLWDPDKQKQADLLLNLNISPEGARLLEDNAYILQEVQELAPWSKKPGASQYSDPHDRVP